MFIKLIKTIAYHLFLYKFKKNIKGIHLGAGNNYINGFINIDLNLFSKSDLLARVNKLYFKENSVEIIYGSHIFEHIKREHRFRVLSKWHKVLKKGGKIYISVPDLEMLFNYYINNIKNYENPEVREKIDIVTAVIYGGQINRYDYHCHGYSYNSIKYLLEYIGFKNVKRITAEDIKFNTFIDASQFCVDNIPVSLIVEAEKS